MKTKDTEALGRQRAKPSKIKQCKRNVEPFCHKQHSLMHGSLHYKRTSTLSTTNYTTVEIVDDTAPVIDAKARHWSRITILPTLPAFDAPLHVATLPQCLVWKNYNGVAARR